MIWSNSLKAAFGAVACLLTANADAQLYSGYSNDGYYGVQVFDDRGYLSKSIKFGFDPSCGLNGNCGSQYDITALSVTSNNIYATHNNRLYQYAFDGNLVHELSDYNGQSTYSALTAKDGLLYSGYSNDGYYGVQVFDGRGYLSKSIELGFDSSCGLNGNCGSKYDITALSVTSNSIYASHDNRLYQYTLESNLVHELSDYNGQSTYSTLTYFGSTVPEPSSWATMVLGMGAIGFALRRHRKVSAQTLLNA